MKPLPHSVRELVDAARVCRIATVRADGEPHVIPVCPVFDGEATVYVDLGPKSATGMALRHEARIAVLIDEYDEDWTRLRKVILKCRAEEISGPEKDAAWAGIRRKFPQYTTVDWAPRMTVALRVYDWVQEGVETPAH